MITPDALTGAYVRERRDALGLSRVQFTALTTFTAQARIGNIEVNDSWKPGDREEVARVLNGLEDGTIPIPDRAPRRASNADAARTTRPGNARTRAIEVARRQRPDRVQLTAYMIQLGRAEELMAELADAVDGIWVQDSVVVDAMADVDLTLAVTGPVPSMIDVDDRYRNLPSIDDVLPRLGSSVLDVEPGTIVLSNSELGSWDRCKRQWWLNWYRGLLPAKVSATDARASGDRVHRALALYYVPDPARRVDPRDALERIIVEDWTRIAAELDASDATEEWKSTQAAEFIKANALERAMVEGYVDWLTESGADAGLDVIGSEMARFVEFDVDGRKIRLISRLDAVVRSRDDGTMRFIDHKTTASMTELSTTVIGDPQMLTYHVIEWLADPENTERCVGALYNMLRKVKRTERAKPPFYDRVDVRHNPDELANHLREIRAKARRILITRDMLDGGANHHDVVPRSWGPHCKWCDFRQVCPMFDDGSRIEDALREHYVRGEPRIRYNDLERFEPKNAEVTA